MAEAECYAIASRDIEKAKAFASPSEIIKNLLKIALPITLSTGLSGLAGMIDLSLIMRRLATLGISELEASALYGNYTTLALPLISFATSLLVPISTACAPIIASAFAKGDYELIRESAAKFLNATLLFATPLSLGFLFFGEEVLTLLFEDSSAVIASPLLIALSPSVVLLSVLNPEPGKIYGTSILKGLPFVSDILLKIYNTIGTNWERLGNVRFSVTYKPQGYREVCPLYRK